MNELEKVQADAALDADSAAVSSAAEALVEAAPEAAEETASNYHGMNREQLLEALKAIVDADNMELHREVGAIKQAYYALLNREAVSQLADFVEAGNKPEDFSAVPDSSEAEIKRLLAEFRERRAAYLEKVEEEKRQNLAKKNEIIDRLKGLVDDIDNINMHFQDFQQLQQDFKAAGDVPPGSETETWKNYQAAVEQFYDRLKMNKELRDLDFKKNLEIKEQLVEKAVELTAYEDPIEAFRKLQELHDQWREIGPVAKEIREDIWNRFKEASTVVNKRHQDYFEARKEEEAKNESAKTALCEKVEGIDLASIRSFNEWDEKTKEIIEAQKAYKEAGFAPRKVNTPLYMRFRKACDAFFTAKAEYFKKTKEDLKENLAKKEALCEKAEALAAKVEEKGSLEALQALQEEWKTIGTVRRKQGDEVWKRFRAAIDAFHEARKKRNSSQRTVENENLKAKQAIVAALKEIPEDSDRREVIGKIRELQTQWQNIGFVPFKHKEAINAEYREQLSRLFSAFDVRENRSKMKKFEGEVKKLEGDAKGMARERERLVRAMETRQAEIKTIENNMGFFKFSASEGNPMLKEFERKIKKLKEDIIQIQEKINLLDSQAK